MKETAFKTEKLKANGLGSEDGLKMMPFLLMNRSRTCNPLAVS
jgi:hypothetical protein